MQMTENFQRDAPHRTLRHPCKEDFTQFGEQRTGKAQRSVKHQQQDRQGQCLRLLAEHIDHLLEHQRHRDRRQLGQDQAGQRQQYPPLVLPEIRHQAAQGGGDMSFAQGFGGVGRGSSHGSMKDSLNRQGFVSSIAEPDKFTAKGTPC